MLLKDYKVDCMGSTIEKSFDLKDALEAIGLKLSNCSVFSIDIEVMYPSVKFDLVERAIKYFTLSFKRKDKKIVKRCLELIKFGMDNTLIKFQDQY